MIRASAPSEICNALRAFRLLDLDTIKSEGPHGLPAWLGLKDFQIYEPVTQDTFTLSVAGTDSILEPWAWDCNRIAVACFESISTSSAIPLLPKSQAWYLIKVYYSAFYGANSIMRILGNTCRHFDAAHTASVYEIANLYGQDRGVVSIHDGYYECDFDALGRELKCRRVNAIGGDSHRAFWTVFCRQLDEIVAKMLTRPIAQAYVQEVAQKLSELCSNLRYGGNVGGSWLSAIRNQVNYRIDNRLWFPYSDFVSYLGQLRSRESKWLQDPLTIDLACHGPKDFSRFVNTCLFIVALCRALVIDLWQDCHPPSKSFLTRGPVQLLQRARHPLA